MIFYGDVPTPTQTRDLLDRIDAEVSDAFLLPMGIERHAAWVTALLSAGELVQGLADAALDHSGVDDDGEPERAAMDFAMLLAGTVGRSWDSGFEAAPSSAPTLVAALEKLRSLDELPSCLDIRRPEGFAHYAVYPESFWHSASRLQGPKPRRVIGIRSIGTTLAATVAAALDAPPPLTLRPTGHPFSRETRPGARSLEKLRQGSGEIWAIVDEGPGLSGSSFKAVADRLVATGTPHDRLILYPSHASPPGAMADEDGRRFWSRTPRRVTGFETLIGTAGPTRDLAGWVGDVTGDLECEPVDVGAGLWRRHRFSDESEWPAVDRQNERRKYLAASARGTFLLKFTGLGAFGHEKMARAKAMAAAGFTLEPLAWRHGFLLEPWRADASPMVLRDQDHGAFLRHLARYLGFRARAFPVGQNRGASLASLWAMVKANVTEALGAKAEHAIDPWKERLRGLATAARPVAIDGNLHAHEWLVDGRGRWIKTDALDHCCGHDLIGCQDIAWDVAGAAVAFELSAEDTERLRRNVESEARQSCDPRLVAFFRIANAAFRIGVLSLARAREDGEEATRLDGAVRSAVAALRRAIDAPDDQP